MRSMGKFAAAVALGLAAAAAQAVVVSEMAPYAAGPFGQQSDANTPPYVQAVSGAAATLGAITWWGYHGVDSIGAANDAFDVWLNGGLMSGTLTTDAGNPAVSRYTLAINPWTGTVSTLSIVNQGTDVEWYWQSAATPGGAHASDVAFRLEGAANAVPEPASAMLLLAGLIGLASPGRSRRFAARG